MAAAGGTGDFAVTPGAVPSATGSPTVPVNRYSAVGAILRKTPQEFHFFQAVRLLERLHPDRAPVGRFVSPGREVVRFAAHASFPFPASQIQNIDWPDTAPAHQDLPGSGAPRMVINFMGLAGPSGVMPLYYTEL